MNNHIRTAYNTNAHKYRKQYDHIGAREKDVKLTLSHAPVPNPFVVEIGCAYGREARHILSLTDNYLGIDISDEFIEMAQKEVPHGTFVRADVVEFDFPDGIDAVFAFASLLHSPKEDLQLVLERIADKLNPGGVVFLSLKQRPEYETGVVDSDGVERRFYYYNRELIHKLMPDSLSEIYYDEQIRKEKWMTIILQKN